jgi:hypothetical protein
MLTLLRHYEVNVLAPCGQSYEIMLSRRVWFGDWAMLRCAVWVDFDVSVAEKSLRRELRLSPNVVKSSSERENRCPPHFGG